MRPAEALELLVVDGVLHHIHCQFPVYLEPLRPFSPLGEVDQWGHVVAVAASPIGAVLVECAHEAELGVGDVGVDGAEVFDGDAGFRGEDEPLVGDVEEGVR